MNSKNLKTAGIVAAALVVSGFLVSEFEVGPKIAGIAPSSQFVADHSDVIAASLVGGVVVTAALVLLKSGRAKAA